MTLSTGSQDEPADLLNDRLSDKCRPFRHHMVKEIKCIDDVDGLNSTRFAKNRRYIPTDVSYQPKSTFG